MRISLLHRLHLRTCLCIGAVQPLLNRSIVLDNAQLELRSLAPRKQNIVSRAPLPHNTVLH